MLTPEHTMGSVSSRNYVNFTKIRLQKYYNYQMMYVKCVRLHLKRQCYWYLQ